MGKDLLRVEPNERVDMGDFEFLVNDGMKDVYRHLGEQFLCDPSRTRSWVVSGFAMSNPGGSQLQVTKGKAILAYRANGVVQYGMVTTEGDATKIVDLNGWTPQTYGVYIRFEYVPGDLQSRLFWDPSGAGTEFAQTINTRLQANWSLRVEFSSPGDEWLKIGEVAQATMAFTSLHEYFFEGAGGGIVDLAAAYTWNGTALVTTGDTSEVQVGDWISLKSDGRFFEIASLVPNTSVTLVFTQLPDTFPAGPPGTSARSPVEPYLSGWSTEGGGTANDRSMDRAAYAVSDLQMFTAAMRQCIEDIKGRGLRKWWEKDIGGMNIGFDAEPTENFLNVGDANCGLGLYGGQVYLNLDTGPDMLKYARATNELTLEINNNDIYTWDVNAFWPEAVNLDLGTATNGWNKLFLETTGGSRAAIWYDTVSGVDNSLWQVEAGFTSDYRILIWNDVLGASEVPFRIVRDDMDIDLIHLETTAADGEINLESVRVGLGGDNSGVDGVECFHDLFPSAASKDLGLTGTRWDWLYVTAVDVTGELTCQQVNVDGDGGAVGGSVVSLTNVENQTGGTVPGTFDGSIKIYCAAGTRYLYYFTSAT